MDVILMLVATVLIYLALETVYQKKWLKNLFAQVDFSKTIAYCGEEINLVETITNQKWMPIAHIHVKFQLDKSLAFEDRYKEEKNLYQTDHSYRNDIFSLMFYQKITRRIPLQCTKRGYYEIKSIEIISKGIFLNDILHITLPVTSQLLVYPALCEVDDFFVLYRCITGMLITDNFLYPDPFIRRGVRDYQSYDPMTSINWKATAKTGSMKVNVYDSTLSNTVCVLLDVKDDIAFSRDVLIETCISLAASFAHVLIGDNISVSLYSNGRNAFSKEKVTILTGSGSIHMESIGRALASIDLTLETEDFEQLLEHVSGQNKMHTVYLMISLEKEKRIREQFEEMRDRGMDILWVMPYHDQQDSPDTWDNHEWIIPWEVQAI